jgi:hypothetical protein
VIGPAWVQCSIAILRRSSRTIGQAPLVIGFRDRERDQCPTGQRGLASVTALGKSSAATSIGDGQAGFFGTVMRKQAAS